MKLIQAHSPPNHSQHPTPITPSSPHSRLTVLAAWLSFGSLGVITIMRPSRLFEFGFVFAGLFAGIAIGIWASLAFFTMPTPDQGRLAQRFAAGFVIAGIILNQVLRFKLRQHYKDDEKPDA